MPVQESTFERHYARDRRLLERFFRGRIPRCSLAVTVMGRDVWTQGEHWHASETGCLHPELRLVIGRVIIPALLERFLRDQAAAPPSSVMHDLPKAHPAVVVARARGIGLLRANAGEVH